MGIVYLCYDKKFNRKVALKGLQDKYLNNRTLVKRFVWEIETWIRFDKHPNIVKAYYAETFNGCPHICLEYIEGVEGIGADLSGWITNGAMDLPLILDFAIQFCCGMLHANKKFKEMGRDFVYRDIKPSNIMVTRDKVLKITDFGLVKLAQELTQDMAHGMDQDMVQNMEGNPGYDSGYDLSGNGDTMVVTHPGTVMGTPPYMSPEQWTNENMDNRSDVYSFGCLLYQMASGTPPFVRDNVDAMMEAHLFDTHKSIVYVPKALNQLIAVCLQKDKKKRYGNFQEIKDILLSIYEGLRGRKYEEPGQEDNLEAWELVNKGISFVNLKYYNDALECFNAAIESRPYFAEAYLNRAVLYRTLNDLNHALSDYTKAIELKSGCADAYFNRGNTLRALRKIKEALADYSQAIALQPDFAEAWFNRGGVHRDLENTEGALLDYTKAIELKPKSFLYYYHRGCLLQRLERFNEAITDYNRTIAYKVDYSQAYFNLALCLEAVRQRERAMDIWRMYIAEAKKDPSQQKWIESAMNRLEELRSGNY